MVKNKMLAKLNMMMRIGMHVRRSQRACAERSGGIHRALCTHLMGYLRSLQKVIHTTDEGIIEVNFDIEKVAVDEGLNVRIVLAFHDGLAERDYPLDVALREPSYIQLPEINDDANAFDRAMKGV